MSAPSHSSAHAGLAIDPSKLRYILATDCGSTTTKAILVERVGDGWRQTQRAEAPTTVEEPFADVTIGVSNSLTEIGELDINMEDLRLEHSPGAQVGLAEISVLPEVEARLASELTARGWKITGELA